MIFNWHGISAGGNASGELEAVHRDEAVAILKAQGIIITEIQLAPSELGVDRVKTVVVNKEKESAPFFSKLFQKKIKEEDLLLFTRKFAAMLEAGLPIAPALQMLQVQSEHPQIKKIIASILVDINQGKPLSDSLAKYPSLFDAVYVSLVKAGEMSGGLDVFLKKLAVNIQKRLKIVRALKSAMSYPVILLAVAVLVIAIMMIFVVPVFAEIFASSGMSLPGPTKVVMAVSNFFRSIYALMIAGMIVGGVIFLKKLLRKNRLLRIQLDRKKLDMPLFGKMIRNSINARFSEVLSNLIVGGVNLIEAIETTKESVSNSFIADSLDKLKVKISSGQPIAKSLRELGAFPETFCGFVEVGEETGRLGEMLSTISLFYEDEFDDAVSTFSQMLEPIMIVFLGGVIGFILVAMYLPIFQMGGAVTG